MYYEKLTEYMLPFLKENGFSETDGVFVCEDKQVKFVYNEAKKVYELYLNESLVSAYLFDETQTEKDIESVAIDFVSTLKTKLGIKKAKPTANQVALPDELKGEKVGVGGLTQKLLAIFPVHKENYKNFVAEKGKYLPVQFCKEYFIPSVKEMLGGGNKKAVKKFYDAMTDVFVASDSETGALVVALLSASVYGNAEQLTTLKEQTAACESLYTFVLNFTAEMKHSKKLRDSLLK